MIVRDVTDVDGVEGMLDSIVLKILGRARHYGFLFLAAQPETAPQGFAASFVSTLSGSGIDNYYLARVRVLAQRIDEPLICEMDVVPQCYNPDTARLAVIHHLNQCKSLVGASTNELLLKALIEYPATSPPYGYSSVGSVKHTAATFCSVPPHVRAVLLFPLGRILERVAKDGVAVFGDVGSRTITKNLQMHCRDLLPIG